MKRRQVLKALGVATVGMTTPASALPEVAVEVENECGTFFGPFDEAETEIDDGEVEEDEVPDDPFTVRGSWLTYTVDPDTYGLSNVQFHGHVSGEQIFTNIDVADNQFAWTGDSTRLRKDMAIEGNEFEARGRHRFEDRDRLRLRVTALDCENGFIEYDLRTNNMVSYYLSSGFQVVEYEGDAYILRDPVEDTDEPFVAVVEPGEDAHLVEANNTRIRVAGEGGVSYRVVTAADEIEPIMELTH